MCSALWLAVKLPQAFRTPMCMLIWCITAVHSAAAVCWLSYLKPRESPWAFARACRIPVGGPCFMRAIVHRCRIMSESSDESVSSSENALRNLDRLAKRRKTSAHETISRQLRGASAVIVNWRCYRSVATHSTSEPLWGRSPWTSLVLVSHPGMPRWQVSLR